MNPKKLKKKTMNCKQRKNVVREFNCEKKIPFFIDFERNKVIITIKQYLFVFIEEKLADKIQKAGKLYSFNISE